MSLSGEDKTLMIRLHLEKADYNVMYNVSRSELEAMKPTADELIKQIYNMLSNQN